MKNNYKQIVKMAAGIVLISSLISPAASAFSDVSEQDAQIVQLMQHKGWIQGVTKDKFAPKGKLTGAQGVHLIVQSLGLKGQEKSSLKFAGKTSWYSESLRIAEENGIELPENFTANGELTREEFAYILHQAINTTGNYPLIKMYIEVADADQGTVLYSGSIQNLLLMKIAALDSKNNFYPKQSITRMDAIRMVYNAVEYINKYNKGQNEVKPIKDTVTYSVEKMNDEVNKVTLTRPNQSNPGYGIRVAKVEFTKQGTATVYYELLSPEEGYAYAQVITDTKATTYISSEYKVQIELLLN
ncbi:S-layer protein sap precursor [compost metagenome]